MLSVCPYMSQTAISVVNGTAASSPIEPTIARMTSVAIASRLMSSTTGAADVYKSVKTIGSEAPVYLGMSG